MSRAHIIAHAGILGLLASDLIGPTETSSREMDRRRRVHDDLHAQAHPPEVKPLAYVANGERERARRLRQMKRSKP